MNLPILKELFRDSSTYITLSKSLFDLDKAYESDSEYYFSHMVAMELPEYKNPNFFINLSMVGVNSQDPNITFPKAVQFYMENIMRQDNVGENIAELAFYKLLNRMGLSFLDIRNRIKFINKIATQNFVKKESNNGWGEIVCLIPNKSNKLNKVFRDVDINRTIQALPPNNNSGLFDNGDKQFFFDDKKVIDFENITYDEQVMDSFKFNIVLVFYKDKYGVDKLHGINFINPFENKLTHYELKTYTQRNNDARSTGFQFKLNLKTCNNEASLIQVYEHNSDQMWNGYFELLTQLKTILAANNIFDNNINNNGNNTSSNNYFYKNILNVTVEKTIEESDVGVLINVGEETKIIIKNDSLINVPINGKIDIKSNGHVTTFELGAGVILEKNVESDEPISGFMTLTKISNNHWYLNNAIINADSISKLERLIEQVVNMMENLNNFYNKEDIDDKFTLVSQEINKKVDKTDSSQLLYTNGDITNVKEALDKLLYVALNIVSFNGSQNVETGTLINNLNLSWSYNKEITSQSIDNGIGVLAKDVRFYTVVPTILTNKTFILTATDGTTPTTKSVNIRFYKRIFYGTLANLPNTSADIRSLPNELLINNGPFNLATGITNKIFIIAIPSEKNLVSVIDTNNANVEISSVFVMNTMFVKDAGNNDLSYKIYVLEAAVPYSQNNSLKITIN